MKRFIKKLVSISTFMALLSVNTVAFAQDVTQTPDLNVTGLGVTETTSNSVTLVWDDIAEAETYRVEYGTEPVVEQGDEYNLPPQEVETNQITIASLDPETTYYFSVVAFGTDKATASQEYSAEVSATTLAIEGFDIEDIEVVGAGTLEISFTESIVLPENPAEEIVIRLLDQPSNTLNVVEVSIDEMDDSMLIVNTEAQSAGTTYAIELSEAFKNSNGDSIPETSRTDSFTGYSAESDDDTNGAMTGLKLDSLNAVIVNDMYLIELDFNDELGLDGSTTENFKIVRTNDPNQFLNITELKVNNQDKSKFLLVTEDQSPVNYSLIMTGLTSLNGQTMSDDNAIVEFTGASMSEDGSEQNSDEYMLSNLKASQSEEGVIVLTWDAPASNDDIDGVNIYFSSNNGSSFESLANDIDPSLGRYEVDELKVDISYQIKVTTTSEGEETDGQVIEFEIAETGPASIAFGILALSGVASWMIRRKNLYLPAGHFLK
jgi:hypothetical protein